MNRLSVSELVEASGMTRPTFYSYFGDRDGLLAEIWLDKGESWCLGMMAEKTDFNSESVLNRAMSEIFLYCHRGADIRELVGATLSQTLEKNFAGQASRSVALWRMANRLGVIVTARIWPTVNDALFLDEYLEGLSSQLRITAPTTEPDLPEIELRNSGETPPELVEAVVRVVQASGLEGLSILRLGRVMRVTSGFLNPRIDDLVQLVGESYTVVQNAAVEQNLAIWSDLKLNPEGFAKFIIGSVGTSRKYWRNFRMEVLVAAAHSIELREIVSSSMDSFLESISARTAALLFPRQLVNRVALLVHTLLFGFTALSNAGIDVSSLAHRGVIRALLVQVAKRFTGYRPPTR
ncbi:MAG: hypothetical protein RL418_143 [Actinomycetota bacterium]